MECAASGKAMQSSPGAVVVALYGPSPDGLWMRLRAYGEAGLQVVAVNNNAAGAAPPLEPLQLIWLNNSNSGGLAGGLNRGVAEALRLGCSTITLLDQDSELDAEAVLTLQRQVRGRDDQVVGPAIWDLERTHWHTRELRPRMLISSGTSFSTTAWQQVGPYHDWMEIDFIDHEWCSRARQRGLALRVLPEVRLAQQFGQRHPNPLAHRLGLQLYSPYRRAIALRNLRWLVWQGYIPLDIRLKETVKMLLKPWCWLALESDRLGTLRSLRAGLLAPLGKPFPRGLLRGAGV